MEHDLIVREPELYFDSIHQELNNFLRDTFLVNAEKQEEEKNERFHTSEFRYGKYQRTISFDQPIKGDDSTAIYKDGVLTITVPKQKIETTTRKRLEIKDKE